MRHDSRQMEDPIACQVFGESIVLEVDPEFFNCPIVEEWHEMVNYFIANPQICCTDFNYDGMIVVEPWYASRLAAAICCRVWKSMNRPGEFWQLYDLISCLMHACNLYIGVDPDVYELTCIPLDQFTLLRERVTAGAEWLCAQPLQPEVKNVEGWYADMAHPVQIGSVLDKLRAHALQLRNAAD